MCKKTFWRPPADPGWQEYNSSNVLTTAAETVAVALFAERASERSMSPTSRLREKRKKKNYFTENRQKKALQIKIKMSRHLEVFTIIVRKEQVHTQCAQNPDVQSSKHSMHPGAAQRSTEQHSSGEPERDNCRPRGLNDSEAVHKQHTYATTALTKPAFNITSTRRVGGGGGGREHQQQ